METVSEYGLALEHYGVPGMRWGVRKAEEETSRKKKIKGPKKSYTFRDKETGKKYKLSLPKNHTYSKEQVQAMGKRMIAKAKRDQEKARKNRILRDPKKLYRHRREFTRDEIESAMKDFEWEKKLKDYSVQDIASSKKMLAEALGYANTLVGVWNTAAGVNNAFNPDSKMPKINVNPDQKKKDKKD